MFVAAYKSAVLDGGLAKVVAYKRAQPTPPVLVTCRRQLVGNVLNAAQKSAGRKLFGRAGAYVVLIRTGQVGTTRLKTALLRACRRLWR